MNTDPVKKTGTTPEVIEGTNAGEINGVIELKTVLVKLRDGHGKEMVKMAIVIPGGEVYFIKDSAIDLQAQTWVKKGILAKLGGK